MKQGSIGAALAVLLALAVSAAAVSNAVTEWQAATAQVVREFNLSTQISAKYYALTNIAQYQVSPDRHGVCNWCRRNSRQAWESRSALCCVAGPPGKQGRWR